jgi:16S rRNA (guanine527-N7)-methyltransferase
LQEKAADYGVILGKEQLDLFDTYIKELIEWNSRMNLSGIKDRGRIILELFLDSLVPAPYLPVKGRLLDVGSGAGFPAIVIKILIPTLNVKLVEANAKKTSFIKQVIRLLKLSDVEVINGRIENIGDKLSPEGFDIVTSRAWTNLNQFARLCSSLLLPGGMLVYYSGSSIDESLINSEFFIEEQRLSLDRLIPYRLPGMDAGRNIIMLCRNT